MDQAAAMGLLARAKQEWSPGNYGAAMDLVQQVIDGRPAWPALGHALQTRAMISAEAGDLEKAARFWEKYFSAEAGQEYPETSRALARYNWAYTLRMQGRYREAVDQYETAAAAMRQNGSRLLADILHNLAWTALLCGDTELAGAVIQEAGALELDGDDIGNQQLCEAFQAHLRGDNAGAQERCLSLLSTADAGAGQRSHACWVLGNVALVDQDVETASNWADQAEQIAKGDPCQYRLMLDVTSLRMAIAQAGSSQSA